MSLTPKWKHEQDRHVESVESNLDTTVTTVVWDWVEEKQDDEERDELGTVEIDTFDVDEIRERVEDEVGRAAAMIDRKISREVATRHAERVPEVLSDEFEDSEFVELPWGEN